MAQAGVDPRMVNILVIQRIGAADKTRIEAVDPAVRLVDAGGWFDGEIRDTWPAFTTRRYIGRNARWRGHARGTRPGARRGGDHPRRVSVSHRPARPRPAPQMVSSAARRGEQPLDRRFVGQRRHRHHLARHRQLSADRRIRGRLDPLFPPRASTARLSTARPVRSRSSRLSRGAGRGQDRLRRRRRRDRPRSRPIVRGARHARRRHAAQPRRRAAGGL